MEEGQKISFNRQIILLLCLSVRIKKERLFPFFYLTEESNCLLALINKILIRLNHMAKKRFGHVLRPNAFGQAPNPFL